MLYGAIDDGSTARHDKQRTSPALFVGLPGYLQSGHFGHIVVGDKNIKVLNGRQSFAGRSETLRGVAQRPLA